MPSSLETERNALKRLISQALGRDHRSPVQYSGEIRSDNLRSDLNGLPLDLDGWEPSQILDPDDPNFGKRRFIVGLSDPFGGDILA